MKEVLFEMYQDTEMGQNDICKICRTKTNVKTMAQTPYLIASRTELDRIFFVSKVARGDSFGKSMNDNLEDVTEFGNEQIHTSHWPYYSYTREIIQKVFGSLDEGLRHITFANIVKCNDNNNNDTTDYMVKEFCINKNGFIWKEIGAIKPQKIIFYTSWSYDDFIEVYRYPGTFEINDIYDRHHVEAVGNKTMPLWERHFCDNEKRVIAKFIRVGHPERKQKNDYVNLLSSWIKKGS